MIEDKQKYWRSLSVESKTGRTRKIPKEDAQAGLLRKIIDARADSARLEAECKEVWE